MRLLAAVLIFLTLGPPGFAARDALAADPLPAATPRKRIRFDRLPPNVTPATQVRIGSGEPMTTQKALERLGARYRKGILVDSRRREIRFFEPLCRGVSAGADEDERERREKERELAGLEENFTVLVLVCDPRSVG